MNLEHITLERLQEIEAERAQTQLDPKFHKWMKDLHVGRLSIDRSGIMRANQMMEDYSKLKNQLYYRVVFVKNKPKEVLKINHEDNH